MITAAMATIATVDMRPCYPCGLFEKTDAASGTARALACQGEPGEHREVRVKHDPLDAANAKRREAVLPLEASAHSSTAARPRRGLSTD